MRMVSKRFVDQTRWPEYEQLATELRGYLQEVTNRVIHEVLDASDHEADDVIGRVGPGGQKE